MYGVPLFLFATSYYASQKKIIAEFNLEYPLRIQNLKNSLWKSILAATPESKC